MFLSNNDAIAILGDIQKKSRRTFLDIWMFQKGVQRIRLKKLTHKRVPVFRINRSKSRIYILDEGGGRQKNTCFVNVIFRQTLILQNFGRFCVKFYIFFLYFVIR